MSKNLIDGVSEKVDGFMQEGIIPKFEEIKTALKEPPRYIIETSSESVANLLYKNFAEDIKKELGENVEKMIQKGVVNIYATAPGNSTTPPTVWNGSRATCPTAIGGW